MEPHADQTTPDQTPDARAAVDPVERLEELVDAWMPLPDVAEHLDVDLRRVRRMLDDNVLVGVRRGSPKVMSVPRALVDPEPMPELPGTLSVLADAGYGAAEALVWLFTPDETLPGTPVENLRAGRKREIRRRAQSLAF